MSIRTYIHKWLGVHQIVSDLRGIGYDCHVTRARVDDILKKVTIQNQALGRIIAKLDPMYAQSELSPERRADSDRIAKEVLNKLHSEHKISGQY